jgi:hypothetical protein
VPIRTADSFWGKADVFVGAAYLFAAEPASQTATPRPSTKFRRRIDDLPTDGDERSAIEVARKSRDKAVPAGVSLLGPNLSEKDTGRARQLCPGTSGDLTREGRRFGFEIGGEMAQRTEVAVALDRHARSELFCRWQSRPRLDRRQWSAIEHTRCTLIERSALAPTVAKWLLLAK